MSGPSSRYHPIDFARKALIVAALIGAMLLLHQFAVPSDDFDPRGLLALGFVVLAAYTIGELASAIRIPHITGYLLAGILFGPSVAELLAGVAPVVRFLPPLDEGILSERVLGQLGLVDSLALALIALTAGGELKLAELRRTFKHVVTTTLGTRFTVVLLVTVYLMITTSLFPNALPVLGGLSPGPKLAIALVVAVLAAATSPAVSIAVINSTGARGPVATTILISVVLGEILVVLLFSIVSSIALGVIGGTGSVSVGQAMSAIGMSIATGMALGVLVSLYLRYVGTELLLFLVGAIYATTFVVRQFEGEAAITFIAAGLVVGNFSGLGETLIREVERLSRPVYVLFFALAGAHLDLDVLGNLLVPALGLFAVRGVGVWFGSSRGARLGGAPESVQTYAWTGFVSQAGVAIALAAQARDVFPAGVGDSLFSISLSVVALSEMLGPLILQTGLQRAGEIPGTTAENGAPAPQVAPPAVPKVRGELRSWHPAEPDHPWGVPTPTGSEALDRAVGVLEIELRALVQEHAGVPLAQIRRDAELWLRQLRRETLRALRRASTRSGEPGQIAAQLRDDAADLAQQWRDLVRNRPLLEPWGPLGLVDALDRHVSRLPAAIEARVVDAVLAPRDEPVPTRIRRAIARARNRVIAFRRSVDLHVLGRYHLSGLVPGRLEELAALVLRAELHVADRIADLLNDIARGFEAAARQAESGDPEQLATALAALRDAVDRDFELAAEELQAIAVDGTATAARIVGGAFADVQRDAVLVGTMDLPPYRRRFGRVFAERSKGLQSLAAGQASVRRLIQARGQQLALELELVGVEARVRSIVRGRAAALARQVRARGPHQLDQVATALGALLQTTDVLLTAPPPAGAVSRHLRRHLEPLVHRIREAQAVVAALLSDLSDERWISEIIEALDAQTQELSESYTIPGPIDEVGATLPGPVPQHEVAFRELVAAFVEARVARDLVDLTGELLGRIREMAAMLEEVERVAAFNVELSCAELDVLDEGAPIPPETVELVRAMVQGAIGRSHHRLVRQLEVAELTADQTEHRVHDSVLGQLEALRGLLLEGRVAELRAAWLRDGRIGELARRAEAWRGWFPAVRERAFELSRRTLGAERIDALRAVLGLPPPPEQREHPTAFPPPEPAIDVPIVYRRLFSELPLEAGDLLAGRDADIERLRRALTSPGPLRTAAIVGVDPPSAAALASAVIRGLFDGVIRLDLRGPATANGIGEWLARVAAVENHAVVVDNVHWLFERRPGGSAPLLRLIDGVLLDRGRNAWVLVADQAVWSWACAATPLGGAVGARVELGPLTVDQLERAILSRHAMSGYGVEFAADDDVAWQLQSVVMRGADRDRRRREAWFRTLHAASAGILGDALRLWMAAIREVDDRREQVRIGAVPRPPLTRLAHLPEDVLLTLLETSRQGWIGEDQHRRLFRTSPGDARAHLASLTQLGLLVRDGGVLRIAPHLRGPLHRVLTWRGWT